MFMLGCCRTFRLSLGRVLPSFNHANTVRTAIVRNLHKRPSLFENRSGLRHASTGASRSIFDENLFVIGGLVLLGGGVALGFYSGEFFPNKEVKMKANSEESTGEKADDRTEPESPVVKAETLADEIADTGSAKEEQESSTPAAPPLPEYPEHAQYLLIGGGTASFAAYRAIRKSDPKAKVLIISEESYPPYMRPPLSKEFWYNDDPLAKDQLKFKQWNGKERSIFFEPDAFYCAPGELSSKDEGGVALLKGTKVAALNTKEQKVVLDNGNEIRFDKLLIAPGGIPKNLPIFANASKEVQNRVTLFRKIDDFKDLEEKTRHAKSVVVVGGGFLGSELACALGHRGKQTGMHVYQVFPEEGNMGMVLPRYLSKWTTNKVKQEGVDVHTSNSIAEATFKDGQVVLRLYSGEEVKADQVIVAVGLRPNVELAQSAGLETDPILGGYHVNSELEARSNIWVAGDAACFYDINLGRRRVEHHDHAVVSGRLAGENMTGARKPYWHQSMFWSDLGPDVGYEAIGLVDSSLPTVGVWAKASKSDTPKAVVEATGEGLRSETEQAAEVRPEIKDKPSTVPVDVSRPENDKEEFGKGVVFYMKDKRVVGILLWNVFNRMPVARKIIKEGKEQNDLNELAKLFNMHQD